MSVENPITILIAEDQEIIRLGIKVALKDFPDLKVVAESEDGMAAVRDALTFKPKLILMDIGLPILDGISASAQIKKDLPGVRLIMFTSRVDDETIHAALGAGADGYCLKNVSSEHLYAAIKAVAMGVAWLDPAIADRVLRTQYVRKEKRPNTQVNEAGDQNLSKSQIRILELLSQGADLDEVAKKLNMSADSVATLVNATIAKLQASASDNTVVLPMIPGDGRQAAMLADRYSIESVLGRGGMGVVYKAKHLLMDRPVAIKMLHPYYLENELVLRRFQSEAKSLSGLSHANLVAVFDFGLTQANEPYMVMDYHEGKGLDVFFANRSSPDLRMTINILSQVCDALSAVHEHNMVHRDIKPSNIVISEFGLVKLVDFGVAKSIGVTTNNLTMPGELVGTPKYMSPEQCMGRELDARSDIYSLGCIMYEVFAGHPPFCGDNYFEVVNRQLNDIPSRLPFVDPAVNLSPGLEAIVFKALAKDPNQRYQQASQLKMELQAISLDEISEH